MRTDRRIDTTKLTVAFSSFAISLINCVTKECIMRKIFGIITALSMRIAFNWHVRICTYIKTLRNDCLIDGFERM